MNFLAENAVATDRFIGLRLQAAGPLVTTVVRLQNKTTLHALIFSPPIAIALRSYHSTHLVLSRFRDGNLFVFHLRRVSRFVNYDSFHGTFKCVIYLRHLLCV